MKAKALIQDAVILLAKDCRMEDMATGIFRLKPAIHYINYKLQKKSSLGKNLHTGVIFLRIIFIRYSNRHL